MKDKNDTIMTVLFFVLGFVLTELAMLLLR